MLPQSKSSPTTILSSGAYADHAVIWLRRLIVFVMAFTALYYAYKSIHWQIMVDSPVMHYVNYLIEHGRKPYTDITDNNMPGAYYTESLAMHVFGPGDLAWRIYDFFLMAVLTLGLVLIARPYDWLAGIFAGGLFLAVHAAEGPKYSVEREQVLTVLLVLGYAALFSAVRRGRPFLLIVFGLAAGIAISIKPTFLPLPLVLLLLLFVVLRRRKTAVKPYMAWAFTGLIAVALFDIGYLLHYGVLSGFLFVLHVVTPTYTSLARIGFWTLLGFSLPIYIPALVLITLATVWAGWRTHRSWTWEKCAIALGAGFGLFSFMVQGKPFWHHRYTFLVLLFLLIGFELLDALRQHSWPRVFAFVAFAFTLFWIVPMSMRQVLHIGRQMPAGQTPFTLSLESDLKHLGGTSSLQDKVQCFDLVYGCLNALYHLDIVENTSYTGDLLLFAQVDSPAAEYFRQKYWTLEHQDPASVIVMSNEWFQRPNSFAKVDCWPAFKTFLQQNYTLVLQRRIEGEGDDPRNPDSYRIYVRNTSPLLPQATR